MIYDDVPCENLDAHQPGKPPPRFPAAFGGPAGGGGGARGGSPSISPSRPTGQAPPYGFRQPPAASWERLEPSGGVARPGQAEAGRGLLAAGTPGCGDPLDAGARASHFTSPSLHFLPWENGEVARAPRSCWGKRQLVKPDRWHREDWEKPAPCAGPGRRGDCGGRGEAGWGGGKCA